MGVGNFIDKAVGVIDPEAGLKRTLYREKMKIFKLDNPFLTKETKAIMNKKEYVIKID